LRENNQAGNIATGPGLRGRLQCPTGKYFPTLALKAPARAGRMEMIEAEVETIKEEMEAVMYILRPRR
jgi:hypothetical protein